MPSRFHSHIELTTRNTNLLWYKPLVSRMSFSVSFSVGVGWRSDFQAHDVEYGVGGRSLEMRDSAISCQELITLHQPFTATLAPIQGGERESENWVDAKKRGRKKEKLFSLFVYLYKLECMCIIRDQNIFMDTNTHTLEKNTYVISFRKWIYVL